MWCALSAAVSLTTSVLLRARAHLCSRPGSKDASSGHSPASGGSVMCYVCHRSVLSNAACAAVHAMLWSVSRPESSQCSPLLRPALAVRECDMSALANTCAAARVVSCGHQLRSRVKSRAAVRRLIEV